MIDNEVQKVVLLRKNLGDTYNPDIPTLPNGATSWIALGHFDEIYTYDLSLSENEFFLQNIKEDKERISKSNNDQVYYHPLYLVGKKQPLVACDEIDEEQFRFLAIVRIYFATTCNQGVNYKKICEDIVDHIYNAKEYRECPIHCRAYYATEFSDVVLDIRTQDFSILQKFVLKTLRDHELIGKMYTYFGINVQFLRTKEKSRDDDIINMISVRFPCSAESDQITTIKSLLSEGCSSIQIRNMYSVNGIDDTLISCKELPTNKLLKVYRHLWDNGNNPENIKSTTRVGFYIDTPLLRPRATDIIALCKDLIALRNDLRNRLEKPGIIPRSWFHMIYESVNTLVRMSKTSVMDEIVYLLAPSLEAFMKNILEATDKKINYHVKTYNGFAESYVNLIEQLMRLEGQLSQNPEYRPVICDIPVFVLEYALAFLSRITKVLQCGDKEDKTFEFLVMPCACPQVEVEELFPAKEKLPGVVQLLIPDEDLYNPALILRPLCHEVAHNVGERFRCREERKKYYCNAIATLVTSELLGTRNNRAAIDMLKNRFTKRLNDYSTPTISQMAKELKDEVFLLTHKEEDGRGTVVNMDNYVYAYLTEVNDPSPIDYVDRYQLEQLLDNINQRWTDINTLFREIYADICLLKLLNLTPQEYVNSLLDTEWFEHEQDLAYEFYAIRIYASLKIIGEEIPVCDYSNAGIEIHKILLQIEDELKSRKDGQYKLPISTNTIADLLSYGKKCKEAMDDCMIDIDHELRSIRTMYDALTDIKYYKGYEFIVDTIDAYRKEVVSVNYALCRQ